MRKIKNKVVLAKKHINKASKSFKLEIPLKIVLTLFEKKMIRIRFCYKNLNLKLKLLIKPLISLRKILKTYS